MDNYKVIENMKYRSEVKERIRDIESEIEGQDSRERAYDQGWMDALKWVLWDLNDVNKEVPSS